MKAIRAICLIATLAAFLFQASSPVQASAEVKSSFLYSLSNFHGKVPYNDVRVRVDRARDEVYVTDGGNVRVFNGVGMEEYWFGDEPELGTIFDLAVDERGDILLLSYDLSDPTQANYFIVRCNYRGEIKEKFPVSGLPREFSPLNPNLMMYRDGNIFLVNLAQGKAVVTDNKGVYRRGYDLLKIINIPEKEREDKELFGFSMDRAGNMLFTVAVLFKAYVVSPEGTMVASFGKAGSAPGTFGVVSGIAADDLGNYLVVERLRSVVMVFDKEFRFLTEFGYRGLRPSNLMVPNDMAVDAANNIYVTQLRRRGVSVFNLRYE